MASTFFRANGLSMPEALDLHFRRTNSTFVFSPCPMVGFDPAEEWRDEHDRRMKNAILSFRSSLDDGRLIALIGENGKIPKEDWQAHQPIHYLCSAFLHHVIEVPKGDGLYRFNGDTPYILPENCDACFGKDPELPAALLEQLKREPIEAAPPADPTSKKPTSAGIKHCTRWLLQTIIEANRVELKAVYREKYQRDFNRRITEGPFNGVWRNVAIRMDGIDKRKATVMRQPGPRPKL